MKKLIDNATSNSGEPPIVEHYLLVFLKFIASVVPTIEYDYTLAI
jgi:ubiquitin-like-conjugating enzyme ATG3|tara:strand:+ start:2141 stop:2275 length:135 start_codon:yes stop_codon:yes gene_type:complete